MDLDVSDTSWPGVAATLVAAAFALAPIGILAGAIVLLVKRGVVVVGGLVYAMTILGGSLSDLGPSRLGSNGSAAPCPFGSHSTAPAPPSSRGKGGHMTRLALLAFGAALAPVALAVFALALRRAKKAGTISEY